MIGYQLVIIWFVAFISLLWPIFGHFDLFDRLVGYWATLMILVAIWEFCLPFNFDLLREKGTYYCENKCSFFSEKDKSIWDLFTPKMYMDLYADYSLADCKYRGKLGEDGFHFVMFEHVY